MSCIIKATALNKHFANKHALKNVEFEIHKGAPVALVGPNGAGKTTLFSILCGYIQPSSGRVEIFTKPPGSAENLSRLAALPQDAQLDPRFSIAKQLEFYGQLQGLNKRKAKNETCRTLELVGLSEVLNEKPAALSHGMRKRATIAQALIGSPDIVMLDEATAGLDPIHAREVRELVASLATDITFILSSHDLTELERLCSQVLYLENGQLQQHLTIQKDQQVRYLTLRMEQEYPQLIASLSAIAHVIEVVKTQDKEYLISLSEQLTEQPLDIEILKICHQKNWRFTQLINGKTLENTLFNERT